MTELTAKERMAIKRVAMPEQDATARSATFTEVNLGLTEELAILEAQRCLQCPKQYCIDGCPVGVNIPRFISLLRNGDIVEVDIPSRSLNMRVSDEELERRRSEWVPPPPRFGRGYGWMFARHIEQADKGCDFDFLKTGFGPPAGEPEIN